MAAFSGVIAATRVGSIQPGGGLGMELQAIAALADEYKDLPHWPDRIAELQQFSAQLDDVRTRLEAETPPAACRAAS